MQPSTKAKWNLPQERSDGVNLMIPRVKRGSPPRRRELRKLKSEISEGAEVTFVAPGLGGGFENRFFTAETRRRREFRKLKSESAEGAEVTFVAPGLSGGFENRFSPQRRRELRKSKSESRRDVAR